MKKNNSVGFLFIILFAMLMNTVEANEDIKSFKTELGLVELLNEDNHPADKVLLDKKVIFERPWFFIHLYKYFYSNNSIIILLGVNPDGSAISNDNLYFLVVNSNREVSFFSNKNFIGRPSQKDITYTNNVVRVNLGQENKKIKYAEFKNNEISFGYKLSASAKSTASYIVDDNDCKFTFNLLDKCILLKSKIKRCEEKILENNMLSSLINMPAINKDNPEFNEGKFDRYCYSACQMQKLPEYRDFKKNLCSQP